MTHSSEPWVVHGSRLRMNGEQWHVVGPDAGWIAAVLYVDRTMELHRISIGDAHRIVACVNACASIPIADLTPGSCKRDRDTLTALSAENERLTKERDSHARACTTATGIADHLTAETMRLQLERKRLEAERDDAERQYNAKCGELHQALVERDRAQEPVRTAADQLEGMAIALRNLNPDRPCIEADGLELYARGIRAALSPEPPAALSNPSETPNGSAAPSPVTDEMAEVLRETLNDLGNGRVPLGHARAALTATLGRKP